MSKVDPRAVRVKQQQHPGSCGNVIIDHQFPTLSET